MTEGIGGIDDTIVATGVDATGSKSEPGAVGGPVSPGTVIGRYVVLSRLGAGAMGVVLAAYDPELDRKVALKLLAPRPGSREAAHQRLRREAQALAKLDHRNVVSVYDVGVHEGRLFVGMEFVDGQTLGAWMAAEPRPWRQVLELFRAAGRGLAAAHEAGLVHRDFKPDNVMLGLDRRVRVMDFGLVRADADDDRADLAELLRRDLDALGSAELTQTGALMGTPAYMSPEQYAAGEVDARSDQFSFCVALYEALYRERPFAGTNANQLALAVQDHVIRDAPRSTKVPGWLRKVVVRGLMADREARWPSMDALLHALADDPTLRRRRRAAAALLLGLAGGVAWGLWSALRQEDQCADMEARLAGVWDDERRGAVEAALEATQVGRAAASWQRVERGLDTYTERWVAARVETCEATLRGEQSSELLDLRMACLDERLSHVQATVEVLAAADETVAEKAIEAVAALPGLERCADAEALKAEVAPPDDPEVALRVKELSRKLIEAQSLEKAGKYEQALRIAQTVEKEAAGLDYPPLQARAWLRLGELHDQLGDYAQAEASLERAFPIALSARMLNEAAEASQLLIDVVGGRLARHDEARRWAKDAEPLARAVGTQEAVANYLYSMARLTHDQGDFDESRGLFEQALAIRERTLGPDHLEVADALESFSILAKDQGRYDQARALVERALAIRVAALGPNHPQVGNSYNSLGIVDRAQGRFTEAYENYRRCLAILEQVFDPGHPRIAFALNNLGRAALEQGKLDEARAYLERALASKQTALGAEHPRVANTLNNLGKVANAEGRHDEAQDYFERALAIYERSLGPDHPRVGFALTGLGLALLGLDRPGDAIAPLERALVIRTANEVEPTDLAETRFALARALVAAPVAGQDSTRARTLAQEAREAYVADGDKSKPTLAELDAWSSELAI